MESVYQAILYKEYTQVEPNTNEVDNIIRKTLKGCRDKYFHSFKYKCVYDIKFKKFTKTKKVHTKIDKRRLKENEKTIFAGQNSFKFSQINKNQYYFEVIFLIKKFIIIWA